MIRHEHSHPLEDKPLLSYSQKPSTTTDVEFDPTWQHPFTSVIAGSTGCGKTHFVVKFLNSLEDMVRPIPTKVIYS